MSICEHECSGKSKALSADFEFASEETYDIYEGDSYDDLGDKFNDWLQMNGFGGWYIDDVIECEKELTSDKAVNPVKIPEHPCLKL
uniref:Uncharacterized protein n=1 Tax=Marseillevirus LCMAC201 TaxID=2506605 RepID=A0A481YX79_9VIRU|nr:MAG: uncharacterized protein LCMAC201_04110 [Marseillevirus LCMAC201]